MTHCECDTSSAAQCVHILGSRVHLVTSAGTVDQIESWIEKPDGQCRRVVVTGFHGLWEAYKNPRLQQMLNSAELWVPDGIAPIWVARLRGHRGAERAPGADIMCEFLRRADQKKYRSYFYGDTENTLSALQAVLARKYPGHQIAGAFSPPFRPLTEQEDREVIERINAARPDVLWVGLGMPKQDIWIYERLEKLKVPVVMGVGAAFAFAAGTVSRCPEWVGRLGFEWVYRFLKEPRKLWRRDLLDGPRFLFHAGLELLHSENRD
ncbi:MAG: WecB/TagA/CpsF family glycosyltransferase [Terracidiphilus sp.]|jgi:N-acetylglucosaminyldiphosphoundecaprenol N-acetyl-beta-D-mannosaminyltransferase